ncbi:hypothetical protein [Streptomyces bicolor]|nr:hypothetical protein [Streptomyces bicolor]
MDVAAMIRRQQCGRRHDAAMRRGGRNPGSLWNDESPPARHAASPP